MQVEPDGRLAPLSEEHRRPITSLGEVMGSMARAVQEEHGDLEATLKAITAAAVRSVPGAEDCSISLVTAGHRVESRAPTGDLARAVDQLQERGQEGPCLDALREHHTVLIDDLAGEQRWPRFTGEARRLGLAALLAFQLFVTGDTLGALNLYARRAHAFDDESEAVGLVFASHAAVALAGAQTEHRLRQAINSRDVIGQAKGILMERFGLTADQAFAVLVRASSETNRKLVEIADELSRTGAIPDQRRRTRSH